MKEIPLTRGYYAIVDDNDFDALSIHKWYCLTVRNICYAVRSVGKHKQQTHLYMHRVIMNPPENMEIDHLDGNGLNNSRSNLKVSTHRENTQNRHHVKTSRYVGVHWHKHSKRWYSQIMIGGVQVQLGSFRDELSAYNAYKMRCETL